MKSSKSSRLSVAPRKVRRGERPRADRAPYMNQALAILEGKAEKIFARAQAMGTDLARKNQRLAARIEKQRSVLRAESRKSGLPVSAAALSALDSEHSAGHLGPMRLARMAELGLIVKDLVPDQVPMPDIDQISPWTIEPGGYIGFTGTGFGASLGKALLELRAGECVELDIVNWSDTYVEARLDPMFGEIPLRPHYGKTWLITAAGNSSNSWPIMFSPHYVIYAATWTRSLLGGLFGSHADGIALEGKTMDDPDFVLSRVTKHHYLDGWSELRSPNAEGLKLEQGYHMGVSAFDTAQMSIIWEVKGPKNIWPPSIDGGDGWSDWVVLGPA